MMEGGDFAGSEPPSDFDERSIDILISLAREGEIDPWDIDIVDVTDKFLAKVAKMEKLDLRISSRTLLFASILLRMKSDVLAEPNQNGGDESDYAQEDSVSGCFPALKPKVRRHARRRVTLSELIEELKKATKRKERSDRRRMHSARSQTIDAFVVAHAEDIERQVECMRGELKKRFSAQGHVLFSELAGGKTPEDIVGTYIPLLFMANRRQITLEQQELFGDIYIKCRNL